MLPQTRGPITRWLILTMPAALTGKRYLGLKAFQFINFFGFSMDNFENIRSKIDELLHQLTVSSRKDREIQIRNISSSIQAQKGATFITSLDQDFFSRYIDGAISVEILANYINERMK